ncbi:uncharacterized protein LOC128177080 isoform X1 [Crassostrea angulata]|uniref:uncharacterized protein LOC128177080 isoform X1 n=1 Tax=Magallana angulata TaxID=2784310 RepID=UPI0022B0F16F|nr:uncharacterized protein LOC128177080 isoform X1 [Crassostrea angulata]XP_052699570.1 uncharacterized protein LOC128177080 isoform X1 [Crassostrea angulata]
MERRIHGVPVVFVLDTSNSMRGEGFDQMKRAFLSIIRGYSDQPSVDHCVAVISFGRETKVLQSFSNDYTAILHILDDIQCEGPSSFKEALEAAAPFLRSGLNGSSIGPFSINANLIIISGGDVTGQDNEDKRNKKMNVLQIAEQIGKVNPIVCVPAGDNPDMCFLGSFAYSSIRGKILDIDEAPQFARYSTNMVVASEIMGSVPTRNYSVDDVREAVRSKVKLSTSEKDICDIYEILTKRQAYGNGSYPNVDCVENDLRCEGDPTLPPIGTRVGRGPNWPFTNQNSGMSGTVVGYRDDHFNLLVEWDTSMVFPYHFDKHGDHQKSNVVVCDVPRVLQTEKIAVGCLVKRGPDWKWFDQDGGKDNIGTVYRVKGDNIVFVRWTNGIKSNYRFGYDGKYDVILCDPFDETVKRTLGNQQNVWRLDDSQKVVLKNGSKCNENGRNTTTNVTKTVKRDHQTNNESVPDSEEKTEFLDKVGENTSTNQNTGDVSKELDNSNSSDDLSSWEWKNKEGNWVSFPYSEKIKIQKAYDRNNKGTVLVRINEDIYRVVLSKMIQINISSRESQEIRHLS